MSQDTAGEAFTTGGIIGMFAAGLVVTLTLSRLVCHQFQRRENSDEEEIDLQHLTSTRKDWCHENDQGEGSDDIHEEEEKQEEDHAVSTQGDEQLGDETAEEFHSEDELVTSTLEKAKHFFPGLDLSLETVTDYKDGKFGHSRFDSVMSPSSFIQSEVVNHVKKTLDGIEQQEKERLMKRENAHEFCLKIGMNPEVVNVKFAATKKFEEEFGFKFKVSIIDSVYHLIWNLDSGNPFGEVNNSIQDYSDKANLPSLRYIGVQAKPNILRKTIQNLQEILKKEKIADCFMHGTTATTLGRIAKEADVQPNYLVKHDFGPGVYCFKGKLEAALSYAFARSWPDLRNAKKNVQIAKICKDNPSVVVFPKGNAPEDMTFHVGFTECPFKDEEILKKKGRPFREYMKKKTGWDKTTKEELQWKHFVKLARCYRTTPKKQQIFHGWLHDSDYVEGTNHCNEPKIDVHKWEQYCFKDPDEHLDLELLFIEVFIDWAEWIGRDVDQKDLERVRTETVEFLVEHERVESNE